MTTLAHSKFLERRFKRATQPSDPERAVTGPTDRAPPLALNIILASDTVVSGKKHAAIKPHKQQQVQLPPSVNGATHRRMRNNAIHRVEDWKAKNVDHYHQWLEQNFVEKPTVSDDDMWRRYSKTLSSERATFVQSPRAPAQKKKRRGNKHMLDKTISRVQLLGLSDPGDGKTKIGSLGSGSSKGDGPQNFDPVELAAFRVQRNEEQRQQRKDKVNEKRRLLESERRAATAEHLRERKQRDTARRDTKVLANFWVTDGNWVHDVGASSGGNKKGDGPPSSKASELKRKLRLDRFMDKRDKAAVLSEPDEDEYVRLDLPEHLEKQPFFSNPPEVCRDFIKGVCKRANCKWFHPIKPPMVSEPLINTVPKPTAPSPTKPIDFGEFNSTGSINPNVLDLDGLAFVLKPDSTSTTKLRDFGIATIAGLIALLTPPIECFGIDVSKVTAVGAAVVGLALAHKYLNVSEVERRYTISAPKEDLGFSAKPITVINSKTAYSYQTVNLQCDEFVYGWRTFLFWKNPLIKTFAQDVDAHKLANLSRLANCGRKLDEAQIRASLSCAGYTNDNVIDEITTNNDLLIAFTMDKNASVIIPALPKPLVLYGKPFTDFYISSNNSVVHGVNPNATMVVSKENYDVKPLACILSPTVFGSLSCVVGYMAGSTSTEIASGVAHRQISAMPPANVEALQYISWAMDCLIDHAGLPEVVACNRSLLLEYVNTRKQTMAWKANKTKLIMNSSDFEDLRAFYDEPIKSFVKREVTDQFKHARMINPVQDYLNLVSGYYMDQIEHHMSKHLFALTKGLTNDARAARIFNIQQSAHTILTNDYSSFEQSISEGMRAVEHLFIRRLCTNLPNEVFNEVFDYYLLGKDRKCNGISVKGGPVRNSGESGTGFLNTAENLATCLCASAFARMPGRIPDQQEFIRLIEDEILSERMLADGDDMYACDPSPNWVEYVEWFSAQAGFVSKAVVHSTAAAAGFCQTFISSDKQVMLPLLRTMMKFNVGHIKYAEQRVGRRYGLLKAKAMSYLSLSQNSPIITALCDYVYRMYRSIDCEAALLELERSDFRGRAVPRSVPVVREPITHVTRLEYQSLFEVPLAMQIEIESSLNRDVFPDHLIAMYLPQDWFDNAHCVRPKGHGDSGKLHDLSTFQSQHAFVTPSQRAGATNTLTGFFSKFAKQRLFDKQSLHNYMAMTIMLKQAYNRGCAAMKRSS